MQKFSTTVVVVVVVVVVGINDISQNAPLKCFKIRYLDQAKCYFKIFDLPVKPVLQIHVTSLAFTMLHWAPFKHTFRPTGHDNEAVGFDVVVKGMSQTSPAISNSITFIKLLKKIN